MQRRDFVRTTGMALLGGIFVPKFERWFRLWQPETDIVTGIPYPITDADLTRVLKNVYAEFRHNTFPVLSPLLGDVRRVAGEYRGEPLFFDVVTTQPRGPHARRADFLPDNGHSRRRALLRRGPLARCEAAADRACRDFLGSVGLAG